MCNRIMRKHNCLYYYLEGNVSSYRYKLSNRKSCYENALVCVSSLSMILTSSKQIPISSTIARQLFCSDLFGTVMVDVSRRVNCSTGFITFQQFIGIVYPLRYKQIVIKRRLINGIILQWVFGLPTNFYLPVLIVYYERILKCTYSCSLAYSVHWRCILAYHILCITSSYTHLFIFHDV